MAVRDDIFDGLEGGASMTKHSKKAHIGAARSVTKKIPKENLTLLRDLLGDVNGVLRNQYKDLTYLRAGVAGGYTRDLLAGIPPKDIDLWVPREQGRANGIETLQRLDKLGWDVENSLKRVVSVSPAPDSWPWSVPWTLPKPGDPTESLAANTAPNDALWSLKNGAMNPHVASDDYGKMASDSPWLKEVCSFELGETKLDLMFVNAMFDDAGATVTDYFDIVACLTWASLNDAGHVSVHARAGALNDIKKRHIRSVNPSRLDTAAKKDRYNRRAARLKARFASFGQNWTVDYVD